MRAWSGARTSLRARIAATAPGSARLRSIPMWYGRSLPRCRKVRGWPRASSGAESARVDAVAYGAKARIGIFPGFVARNADHLHVGAASEAQPLHHGDHRAAGQVAAFGKNLMARLAADSQWLGALDTDLLEV